MESAIKWYYRKIHLYDLNEWEKNVQQSEKFRTNILSDQFKQHSSVQAEFIDVDLIRGSTFSKSKPQLNGLVVLWLGCIRIIFFPLFFRWWMNQTSLGLAMFGLLLYVLELVSLYVYLISPTTEFQLVPPSEMFFPFLLMLIVGLIHCQISSTKDSGFYNSFDDNDVEDTASSVGSNEDRKELSEETVTPDGDRVKAGIDLPELGLEQDIINVRIWEHGKCHKVPASFVDIGCAIMRKAYLSQEPEQHVSSKTALFFSTSFVPFLYRWFMCRTHSTSPGMWVLVCGGHTWRVSLVVICATVLRFVFTAALFVMLFTATRTFRKRFFFAKYFNHLTSCRRAMKNDLPHFRLNKVKHIKAWLSLRSYLQRRGPQRSTDIIFSASCTCSMFLLCFASVQMIDDSTQFMTSILYWECSVWLAVMAVFLFSYISTGARIHKKYKSTSVLLTEQFNLYLQMERKPEKKDVLQRVNNVIAITSKLLKETGSINIIGLTMNPVFYNLIRVLVLSAFSGAISEMLGFKVKVWKIKP